MLRFQVHDVEGLNHRVSRQGALAQIGRKPRFRDNSSFVFVRCTTRLACSLQFIPDRKHACTNLTTLGSPIPCRRVYLCLSMFVFRLIAQNLFRFTLLKLLINIS